MTSEDWKRAKEKFGRHNVRNIDLQDAVQRVIKVGFNNVIPNQSTAGKHINKLTSGI